MCSAGIPLNENHEYEGSWLAFLNPFALMGTGVTTLALFMMHGAIYLAMKTEGRQFTKTTILLQRAIIFFIVSFGITSLFALLYIPHLSDDFRKSPSLFIVPLLAFLSIANVPRLANKHRYLMAFIFSSLTVALPLTLIAIELYPVLLFSTSEAANHLTVYNAASSEKSLGIMLIIAAIGTPLVLAYTVFVYKTFWGKVKMDETSY